MKFCVLFFIISSVIAHVDENNRVKRGATGALHIVTNHAQPIHADVKSEAPTDNTEKTGEQVTSPNDAVTTYEVKSLRKSLVVTPPTTLTLIRSVSRVATLIVLFTELEHPLNVNKREKQYLMEDDPFEGSEQRRDGRQSTPKNNQIDFNPSSNAAKVRYQPKVLTAPPKPTMKPMLTKPLRVDKTPQRIPTKIPIVLKSAKVGPTPANALRMKILESKYNETLANREKLETNTNQPPQFTVYLLNETHPNSNDNENFNVNTISSDSTDPSDNTNDKDAKDRKSNNNQDEKITPTNIKKPIHYFVDEPEPLPPKILRIPEIDIKETEPNKIKEIPIAKKPKNKAKKNEIKSRISSTDSDDDLEITRISNGTHLISIKKLRDDGRPYHNVKEMSIEERILNKPIKPTPVEETEPRKLENFEPDVKETITAGVLLDGTKMETKDQNCITIRNHNYEEIEEKSPLSEPISVQPVYNEFNQDYLRYLQNSYYNPYYQTINDQYRRNYGLIRSSPNIYLADNNNPCVNNEEIIQPNYDSNNEYGNSENINVIQQEVDSYPENILDRKWKNWKDVEIKIRNAKIAEPYDIDIRSMAQNRHFQERIDRW
ncbi:hypothetical protein HF086_011468 [Spodoptera exigua]|uniref:Uncharacterized protein n=1 Tax=Spodoptera exigua TaxID=7107 RepID=A0A922M5E1_SPOEX|nr:hypothetical protein HF086_011468 [Spodoptera exigua]